MHTLSKEQAEQVYGGALAHPAPHRQAIVRLDDNVDPEVPPGWPFADAPRLFPPGPRPLDP